MPRLTFTGELAPDVSAKSLETAGGLLPRGSSHKTYQKPLPSVSQPRGGGYPGGGSGRSR